MPGLQDQMMAELMARLRENPAAFHAPMPVLQKPRGGMTPDQLHTIGGLADAASTYYFLKRRTGREGNPLVTAVAGESPAGSALAALGGLAASKGAVHLLRKKWPKLADALAANLGAQQLALGVVNVNRGVRPQGDGYGEYVDAFRPREMK